MGIVEYLGPSVMMVACTIIIQCTLSFNVCYKPKSHNVYGPSDSKQTFPKVLECLQDECMCDILKLTNHDTHRSCLFAALT